ncbi:MAG: hypothetical protein JNK58_08510 [Phycisphaerae bacterium]|nr:hypothetical protein [Phycisphaerae bacterium]
MINRTFLRAVGAIATAAAICFLPVVRGVSAQGADSGERGDASADVAASGEVAVRVETFGVGNVVRAGDWAGVRLALKDSSDRPRTVAVRVHLKDSDGDTALHTRLVTLNPGMELGTWLYLRMPWDVVQGSVLRVSIAEVLSEDDGSVRVGRQLSWKPIAAATVLPAHKAIAYVVGVPTLGLDQYSMTLRDRDVPAAAHEAMQTISGLTPESLPDMWTGLGAGEVMLWSEGDPSLLGEERAQAVREWVNRGGHLVVVLPGVGGAWTSPTNPLADLLPACRIDRLAEVEMSPYRVLLSGSSAARESLSLPLHRFTPLRDASVGDATAVLTGPHGVISVRRLVGTGMVTLIGLDLSNRKLTRAGWVRADAFWSRILGRRGATPTQAEIEASLSKRVMGSSSPEVWVDERIMATISKSREAGVGVLLGLVLFAAYWVMAGPLSFYVLRARGLERHAWIGFVIVSGLFTAFAWAGAQSLRPKREEAWHLTILDHVFGQPVSRARTFVSVLLPQYGDQRVTLGQAGTDTRWSQALTPLSDPMSPSIAAFPDSRGYTSDVRSMTDLVVPARSTIKTFQGDWLGGPRWSMPRPVSSEASPRLDSTGRLVGTLTHDLPGALVNPRVILVTGQVSEGVVGRTLAVSPAVVGKVYAWAEPTWEAGTALDLSKFQPGPSALATKRLADLVPKVSILNQSIPASVKDDDLDDAMALFGILEQPELDRSAFSGTTVPSTVHRRMTHTLDLSRWVTQPCVIVIGTVVGEANPVPMSVDGVPLDGRSRPSSGRTVVRWVYPLAASPLVVGGGPGAYAGDASRN